MNAPSFSFVIPALNEEQFIANSIRSIKAAKTINISEIIVVDNGSSDKTREVALSEGAIVYELPEATIAGLRNFGVQKSSGDIIVFIDADVTLTSSWHQNIENTADLLQRHYKTVTGSHCLPGDKDTLLNKYWFSSFEKSTSSHMGSGHLIITRRFFLEIGGFSEELRTGEDYDLCSKAVKNGGVIKEELLLRVVHNDFPKNMFDFIKREAWHGTGDLMSFQSAIKSKVIQVCVLFIALHLFGIYSIVQGNTGQIILFFGLIVLLMIGVSYRKFRHLSFQVVLINAYIYYFYFYGRCFSIFLALSRN